jgi:polysaccharide chain length determinant protein (PEP-CTERM system associated)
MLPGKKYKPEDILKILRRRYWLILVPWAMISAGTAAVARRLPNMYRSQAVIQVVAPQVPDSIIRPVSSGNFQDRLNATQQTILSRTRLERVINDFNLYQDERKRQVMEEVVDNMRTDITVKPSRGDSFTVAYVGRDPVIVMKVTERLAAYFKDESQVEGERRAEGTNAFVESQVEEKERALKAVEDKLTQYKLQHAGELPTQVTANLQALQTINQNLNAIANQMSADQNSKTTLETNIQLAESQADPGGPLPAGAEAGTQGTAAQRLAAAKALLAAAELRMTPDNPQIKLLKEDIKALQRAANDEEIKAPVGAAGFSPQEQMRQARLKQWRDDLEQTKKRIAANQVEEKRLRLLAESYQAKVNNVPIREAEMVQLNRDYDTLSSIYRDFLAKREASQASVDLERRQIGEQFNLLDQARVPEKPFSPDRTYINMFGVVGGLALGLALVALIEYRDGTFKTDHEISSVLSLPVLAVVPLMRSAAETRTVFRRKLLMNLGLGSTVMVCLAVLAYVLVR